MHGPQVVIALANHTMLDYKSSKEPAMTTVKKEAHKLIDQLPDDATWEDLMREIYVRKTIEQGIADSQAGRTSDVNEVRRKYGLPEK